jgi:hypothetical protein
VNAAQRKRIAEARNLDARAKLEASGGKAAVEKLERELDRKVRVTYDQLARRNNSLEEQLFLCRRRLEKALETIKRKNERIAKLRAER